MRVVHPVDDQARVNLPGTAERDDIVLAAGQGEVRSLYTMNPVSTPIGGPAGGSTRWVSAWPPRRSAASKRVT
jgi:hypothetical protein